MSGWKRRGSLAAAIVAVPLQALAGRAVAGGIHGSPEETSFWVFTVGEPAPDAGEYSTITLSDHSRPDAFLWGGGLTAAGGALLVLGVRGLRRRETLG